MGKVIVIGSSLVVAIIMTYLTVSHDISDFCVIRESEFWCSEWDYMSVIVYVGSYLFYGALLGLAINYFMKKKSHP